MSSIAKGIVHLESVLGTVASHPEREAGPAFFVAPAVAAETKTNVLRFEVIPIGCLGLRDALFDFDSSFVTPDIGQILKELPALRTKHQNAAGELPPLSVFGHADPVSNDAYNKELSGRRAKAIFGLLTHNVKIWDTLFDKPFHGDDWKKRNVLGFIAGFLNLPAGTPRAQLFQAYMTALFPSVLTTNDFLARGKDSKGKGDFQGCSEFNPLIVLSKSEASNLPKPERDDENRPNRRVVVFLFKPGSIVDPALWPCPNADDGVPACTKRFFADGDARRSAGAVRRNFSDTKDTFACRFYDRLAHDSPCEIPRQVVTIDVFFQRFAGTNAASGIEGLEFTLTSPGTAPLSGKTPPDGKITVRLGKTETAKLEILGSTYEISPLTEALHPITELRGVQQRLNMLGYNAGAPQVPAAGSNPVLAATGLNQREETELAIINFQSDNDPLFIDGIAGAKTQPRLQKVVRDAGGE
jgi:hypothetical protein